MAQNVTIRNISNDRIRTRSGQPGRALEPGDDAVVDLDDSKVLDALSQWPGHYIVVASEGGGNGESPIQKVTTTLTHDDILTLVTIPVEVIPAPGDGKALDVLRVFLNAVIPDSPGGAYTNIASDGYFFFQYAGGSAQTMLVFNDTYFGNEFVTAVLGEPGASHTNTLFLGPWYDVGSPDAGAQPITEMAGHNVNDRGIEFGLANPVLNDLEDGAPENSLIVTSLYWVVDLTGYVAP